MTGPTVPEDALEILATIKRNQEMISILTANNDQLVKTLMVSGIRNSVFAEMQKGGSLNGIAGGRLVPERGLLTHEPLLLEDGKNGKTRALNNNYRLGARQMDLLNYALGHDGKLDLIRYRDDFLENKLEPISFVQTSMYLAARNLVKRGFLKKLKNAVFQLVKKPPFE